jgi:hypothetical protein
MKYTLLFIMALLSACSKDLILSLPPNQQTEVIVVTDMGLLANEGGI